MLTANPIKKFTAPMKKQGCGQKMRIDLYSFGQEQWGRKYRVTSSVNGFEGQRKVDEITEEGNTYDFGSRTYDARVGRWWSVDPQRQHYPGMSPYSAFGNNPLYLKDDNGKILTDPNGKPIYIDNGETTIENERYDDATGQYIKTSTKVQNLTYFTNAGEPIYAFKVLEVNTVTQDYALDREGNTPVDPTTGKPQLRNLKTTASRVATENEMMDCHGYTFVGKNHEEIRTWIMSYSGKYGNVEAILKDDGWKEVEKPDIGDVAVFRNSKGISHSAAVSGFDKKGQPIFTSKNEASKKQENVQLKNLKNYGTPKYFSGGTDKRTDKIQTDNTGKTKATASEVKQSVSGN